MITHELLQAIIQERTIEAARLQREHEALAQRRARRPRSGLPLGLLRSAIRRLIGQARAVDPAPARSSS